MENIVDVYGDVIVAVLSIMIGLTLVGICMTMYRYGIILLFNSIMYGG